MSEVERDRLCFACIARSLVSKSLRTRVYCIKKHEHAHSLAQHPDEVKLEFWTSSRWLMWSKYLIDVAVNAIVEDERHQQLLDVLLWDVKLPRNKGDADARVWLNQLEHNLCADVFQEVLDVLPNEGVIINRSPVTLTTVSVPPSAVDLLICTFYRSTPTIQARGFWGSKQPALYASWLTQKQPHLCVKIDTITATVSCF